MCNVAMCIVLQVVNALPQSWFTELEGDSTLLQLQNLARILAMIASSLNQQAAMGSEATKRAVRYSASAHSAWEGLEEGALTWFLGEEGRGGGQKRGGWVDGS